MMQHDVQAVPIQFYRTRPSQRMVAGIGQWLQQHAGLVRKIQWGIVLLYAILILVPVCLPLPGNSAHLWSNMTLIAQFMFWGIWWPFVLISMVLMGRVWCGVLCPEGALTEFASKHGRGWSIPRWMRWGGWPFAAFALTTIYGQMVSVYEYPKAVLLVLGGSTVAAVIVGYLYGREKRVWCKYLCPVNGVFRALAKLAPWHFKVSEEAWRTSYGSTSGKDNKAVNCAPLLPLRHMKGAADCHMCGRCSAYRGAIALTARPMSEEIVHIGRERNSGWESILILFGMLGIAIGAFHWTASPWFIAMKQGAAEWLVSHDVLWPLDTSAPWWLLTHYPERNDVFSWLDGSMLVTYILLTGLVLGTLVAACFAVASRLAGSWSWARFHHLVQALIPLAGCGVFLGLSATTMSLLRGEQIILYWVNDVRAMLLAITTLWSMRLAWLVLSTWPATTGQRITAMLPVTAGIGLVNTAWFLMFWWW